MQLLSIAYLLLLFVSGSAIAAWSVSVRTANMRLWFVRSELAMAFGFVMAYAMLHVAKQPDGPARISEMLIGVGSMVASTTYSMGTVCKGLAKTVAKTTLGKKEWG